MLPEQYAQELCVLASRLLQQAENTQEAAWIQDAIECYHQAMALAPDLLEPYLALAWLWILHDAPENARPFLSKARILEPMNLDVLALWHEIESLKAEKPR